MTTISTVLACQPFGVKQMDAGRPVPTCPVPGTGIFYVAADGSLHYVSPAGTDTQIAPA